MWSYGRERAWGLTHIRLEEQMGPCEVTTRRQLTHSSGATFLVLSPVRPASLRSAGLTPSPLAHATMHTESLAPQVTVLAVLLAYGPWTLIFPCLA